MSTGRGATAAAFVRRAFRRRDLRPGYGGALASSSERRSKMGQLQGVPDRNEFGLDVASPYENLNVISTPM